MGSAGQEPEHPLGVLVIRRLPENLASHNHGRVGGEHKPVRHALADRVTFRVGDASDVGLRRFARFDIFVHVSRLDFYIDPGLP
jgi:hypothetical protein